jgi:hypothetical protein
MGAEVNTGCAVQLLSNGSSKVATRDPLNEGVVKIGITCVGDSSLLLPACLAFFSATNSFSFWIKSIIDWQLN